MIADEELLAACRSAGKPGTGSHREACRLYRRAILEWRAQGPADTRATVARVIAVLAGAAEEAGWGSDCGTYLGYRRHIREKTPVCPPCAEAECAYKREWYHARVRALNEQAQREAA